MGGESAESSGGGPEAEKSGVKGKRAELAAKVITNIKFLDMHKDSPSYEADREVRLEALRRMKVDAAWVERADALAEALADEGKSEVWEELDLAQGPDEEGNAEQLRKMEREQKASGRRMGVEKRQAVYRAMAASLGIDFGAQMRMWTEELGLGEMDQSVMDLMAFGTAVGELAMKGARGERRGGLEPIRMESIRMEPLDAGEVRRQAQADAAKIRAESTRQAEELRLKAQRQADEVRRQAREQIAAIQAGREKRRGEAGEKKS